MLLILLLLFSFVFGQVPPEYILLKKFKDTKDVGVALFLLDNYSDAVFSDELRVELAEVLLSKGERGMAKHILQRVNLKNVRDEYGKRVLRLWKILELDLKPFILRFPEHATDMIGDAGLTAGEKEDVLKRLLSKRKYKDVLRLSSDFCLYKGIALLRMKRLEDSLKTFLGCDDERTEPYLLSTYLSLGKIAEAEAFAKLKDSGELYYSLGWYFLSRAIYNKARKYFIYTGGFKGTFYVALVDYIAGRYALAFEEFSEAESFARGSLERTRVWFWKYKVLLKLGYKDLAFFYLKRTADLDGFYATVAKKILGKRAYNPASFGSPRQNRATLARRLKVIKDLGFLYYMRLEAFRRTNEIVPEDIFEILKFDPFTAIKLSVRVYGVGSDIYRAVAFPTPHREVVARVSRRFRIDPPLIYAVMRQESLFDPVAVSRSNAKGLMQLLDRTARWKAERIGLEIKDIFDVETNITLGVAYLRYLLDLWNGDLVRAIASYNAGQGAVSRWTNYEDDFVFIESIPYRETRNYVKRVLWFYYVYSDKLSE